MAVSAYLTHLSILAGIYLIAALGLNIAVGYTGLFNLSHVAFFGIGAYAAALLSSAGFPVWQGIATGVFLGAGAGLVVALCTKRLVGDYLALATLGFTFITASVARNWQSLTGGALGIAGIPSMTDGSQYYLGVVAIIALIAAVGVWLLSKSSLGRRLYAVRDDATAAACLGINILACRVTGLVLSGALAGLAGGLYAHYITFVDPNVFHIDELVLLFSIVIVGGLGRVSGTVAGTAVLLLLPEPLRFIGIPGSVLGPVRAILFSLFLLIVLIYRPRGIVRGVGVQ